MYALLILAVGVAIVIGGILGFRLHAFLALLVHRGVLPRDAAGLGTGLVHQHPHTRDRAFQPAEYSLADKEVADIEFLDGGDRGDRPHGIEGQAVPGVTFEPETFRMGGGLHQPGQFGLRGRATAVLEESIALGPGVELDHGGAQSLGGIQLVLFGVHEQ